MAKPSTLTHIKDLTPDPHNARRHTPRNIGAIVDSLHAVGAGRGIVIDEDGVILAGNGMIDAAAQAGITKLQVVEADGETVIAVRRRGLTDQQKIDLAIADNRTSELAEWDTEVLAEMSAEGTLPDGMWTEAELDAMLGETGGDTDGKPRKVVIPRPTEVVWVLMAIPLDAWSELSPQLAPIFERADIVVQNTRAAETKP